MKLSIITINLNNATGLRKTIDSVFCQTYRDFEYIIIDGESADGSVEIINQYKERINYWVSEKDKGIYNAMNKGLKIAKGEYIQFLNSGDCLYDDKVLEFFSDKLEGTDIIYGDVVVYKNNKEETREHSSRLTLLGLLERSRHLCHQAVIMSRKSIDEAGGMFDENIKLLSDWKLIANALIKNNASYKHVRKVIITYDLDGETSKKEAVNLMQKKHLKVLKEDYPLFYDDFISINNKQGITYSEVANSSYFRISIKLKKILNRFLKNFG